MGAALVAAASGASDGDPPWAQASIAFSVAMLLMMLGPDAYSAWGWRLLFVLGALASIVMLIMVSVVIVPYLARNLKEL